jgi:hypothetical protein
MITVDGSWWPLLAGLRYSLFVILSDAAGTVVRSGAQPVRAPPADCGVRGRKGIRTWLVCRCGSLLFGQVAEGSADDREADVSFRARYGG